MAKKSELSKLLGKEKFGEIEGIFRKHFQMGLEATDRNGREINSLCSGDCHPAFCQIVRGSVGGLKKCIKQRGQSLEMAVETGQGYITICHAGIVLVCVPVMDKDKLLGGLFFGKCLWESATKATVEDMCGHLKGIRIE